ncbi:MAG TPA: response regulator [Patescibacteria group bacterium]|nr:response regulator [Patescibacteria group bacterium]
MNVILYGKPKVLFVVEELLKSIISVKNVSVFEHFPLAWEYLEQHNVDMIILDADDDTTGWQYLAENFGKINRQAKIVILSCNMDNAVRAYEAGVLDYLLKPVKKKQLERVVAKARYK